jgi:hypothetical protein
MVLEVGGVVVVGHLEMVQNRQNGFLVFFLFYLFFCFCGIGNSRNFLGGRRGEGGKAFLFFCKFKLETDSCFPLLF